MTDKEDKDSIEGSDSSNGNIAECVVPKKKSKKELANPKLSWFEENVIQKNTKEREEFTKKILASIQLLTNWERQPRSNDLLEIKCVSLRICLWGGGWMDVRGACLSRSGTVSHSV